MKVGYARVSTFEQDLDLQMDALEKEGCARIFCDQGESGAKSHRPEWDNKRVTYGKVTRLLSGS